jgi:hypothetical protein
VRDARGAQGEHVQRECVVDAVGALLGVAQIHRERGLAVRLGRNQPQVARALGRALRRDEAADVLGSLVPAREWRHFPDGVGGEQLHDGGDVVVFERPDVPGEQLTLVWGIGFDDLVLGRCHLVELSPSPSSSVSGG